MENNKITETIWAENTVPPKEMIEKYKFSDAELLTFAINILTATYFEKKGFKILDRQNALNKLPNITVEKDNKKFGISVVPYIDPKYRFLNPEARIGVTKVLKEKNILSVFCPVGISSHDKARHDAGVLLKFDEYNIKFKGFVVLNDSNSQDLVSKANFIKDL